MKEKFEDIDELLEQIDIEREKYQTAINHDKPFEEVKKIYLRIKEYQKHLHLLIDKRPED